MTLEFAYPEWVGPDPLRSPNAGHRLHLIWADEDRRRFGEMLRATFPNVTMVEEILNSKKQNPAVKPELRILDRLDESQFNHNVEIIFPHPDWKPDIVFRASKGAPRYPDWSLDQYWSPTVSLMTRIQNIRVSNWRSEAGTSPVEYWSGITLETSYRKDDERERLIQRRVLTIAKKLGRKMVCVRWPSYEAFVARTGAVNLNWMQSESHFASQAAIDWLRTAPARALALSAAKQHIPGNSWMPPEDIPDTFWGNHPKPKWVLEAIEAHRKQGGRDFGGTSALFR